MPADVKLLYDRQILRVAAIAKVQGLNLSTTQAIEILVQLVAEMNDKDIINQFG